MDLNEITKVFNLDEILKVFEDFRKLVAKLNAILNPPSPTPGPSPGPGPQPEPPPDPGPPVAKHIIIADMDAIPEKMRAQGWQGRDTQLWYALCHTYAQMEWFDPYNDSVSTALYNSRDAIYAWWDAYIMDIGKQMAANSRLTATIIVNDKNDAGGLYLGPAIRDRLADYADRLEMGEIYYP